MSELLSEEEHPHFEEGVPVLAVNTSESQCFAQVCFVADQIRGQVGPVDLLLGQTEFGRWADAVPLGEEITN
jgi:hypothetical protein